MILNLEEIKSHLDARAVLAFIDYKKSSPASSGGELRDYCPLHGGDNQKSLAINEKDGTWYCHSCNAKGGDLISLFQQAKNLDFNSAVKELAGHFGIPVEEGSITYNDHIRGAPKGARDEKLAQSRTMAAGHWMHASEIGSHPYFEAKGIQPPLGVRYSNDEKGNPAIVIPYRDLNGVLQAIQFISHVGTDGKRWAKDSKKEAAFFALGSLNGAKSVYLSEGLATTVSIFESQNKSVCVLSCADAGNVHKVAKALRTKYPDLEIVICMDADAAGEKAAKEVLNLVPNASFRRPSFEGLTDDGQGFKDFNDLHRLAGIEVVRAQLLATYIFPDEKALLDTGRVELKILANYFSKLPLGIDIGLKTGTGIHDRLLLPAGGYTVFCAPTKHGKTAVLVNVLERHLWRDPDAIAVFITLEELEPPIVLRFLNRFLNEEFSRNNANTLSHYFRFPENSFAMFSEDWKRRRIDGESTSDIFRRNIATFDTRYLASGRLRILSFNTDGGTLSQAEILCRRLEEMKKKIPQLKVVGIDYLQLIGLQSPKNRSRDEVLKEVCLQLKDLAARTGLVIVTAGQFNRTVQSEDDLHSSAIGEAGSIERHAALAIGMWTRRFQQFKGGAPDPKKMIANEMLLNVMLNRHGSSGQKFVVPYNGNIGLVDFENAMEVKQENAPPTKKTFNSTVAMP